MTSQLKSHFATNTDIPTIHKTTPLRVLHTSDWHLGKLLHTQSRYDEFAKFLDWLLQVTVKNQVDVLIVAGDIFDTMTPSNRAEQLYHQFLADAYRHDIKHIIIVAGNHDSPTNLQKTKEVLGILNTQVVGHIGDDAEKEVLTLTDTLGVPMAIVMAVPYLRDRDVRTSGTAQDASDRTAQLLQGIAEHYQTLADIAKQKQQAIFDAHQIQVPIIATGHLFAAGASVSSKDDGMRDLQVGTLGQISADIFDECIDYVALGHIHAPQKVAGKEHIRYCGSPIAMGFGEIGKEKQVLLVDFTPDTPPVIHQIAVPIFHSLASIRGNFDAIIAQLDELKQRNEPIWLEIEYTGSELIGDLRSKIITHLENSQILALSIQNKSITKTGIHKASDAINLQTLSEIDVFDKRLANEDISDEQKSALRQAYKQLLQQMYETDSKAK